MTLVGVAVFGAFGALIRWRVARTLLVNVAGSFILGVLAGVALYHDPSVTLRAMLGTGFCGALTTWSTFTWETVRLVEEGAPRAALVNVVRGIGASVLAGALGISLAGLL
jgi:CrcB protein